MFSSKRLLQIAVHYVASNDLNKALLKSSPWRWLGDPSTVPAGNPPWQQLSFDLNVGIFAMASPFRYQICQDCLKSQQNHQHCLRVTESFSLEKTFKIVESNHQKDAGWRCGSWRAFGAGCPAPLVSCSPIGTDLMAQKEIERQKQPHLWTPICEMFSGLHGKGWRKSIFLSTASFVWTWGKGSSAF